MIDFKKAKNLTKRKQPREEVRHLTVRVPRELHYNARLILTEAEKTFQDFFIDKLKELVG